MESQITFEQAASYMENDLNFNNWRKIKDLDPKGFVEQLMQKFLSYSYFHNIDMISAPEEERDTPSEGICIDIGLRGLGGVCIHQNYFFASILQSLGYKAYIAAGSYVATDPDPEGTHCIGILTLDDQVYAVDVGCGNPTDEPISLNSLPYTKKAGGFRYEYRHNKEENWYERWQLDGTITGGLFDEPNKAQLRYRFTLKPQPFSHFKKILGNIFTNKESSVFLRNAFLFRRLEFLEDGNGLSKIETTLPKYVIIFGKNFTLYDENGREGKTFDNYKEMESLIVKYFPKLNSQNVKLALKYLDSI